MCVCVCVTSHRTVGKPKALTLLTQTIYGQENRLQEKQLGTTPTTKVARGCRCHNRAKYTHQPSPPRGMEDSLDSNSGFNPKALYGFTCLGPSLKTLWITKQAFQHTTGTCLRGNLAITRHTVLALFSRQAAMTTSSFGQGRIGTGLSGPPS